MNKAIFLDRDGVLIRERGEYNYLPEHFAINDGRKKKASEKLPCGQCIIRLIRTTAKQYHRKGFEENFKVEQKGMVFYIV